MNIEKIKRAFKLGRITAIYVETFLGKDYQIRLVSRDGTNCGMLAENQQDYYSVTTLDEAVAMVNHLTNNESENDKEYCDARAFYISAGESGLVVNSVDAMLGFVSALADYNSEGFRSIKAAFSRYISDKSMVNALTQRAKDYIENPIYGWQRWPSLPVS